MKQSAKYLMALRPAGSLFPAADARHESRLLVWSSDDNVGWGTPSDNS